MKFVDGLMIHSGDPCNDYVDTACRHVLLRQGVLGIKVKIMLPWDAQGKMGPKRPLPDHVSIVEPKDEVIHLNRSRKQRFKNQTPQLFKCESLATMACAFARIRYINYNPFKSLLICL